MSSIREQALDAIVTAWNTDTPTDVPTLERERFEQVVLTDATPRAADLRWADDQEEDPNSQNNGPLQLHDMIALISVRVAGSDDERPDVMVDPAYCWATKVLNDNALSGLVQFMRISGSRMARTAEDRPLGNLLIAVRAKFVSDALDAESN